MKKYFLLASVILLSACGPKPGTIDATTAKKQQDTATQYEIYNKFAGVYCGSIIINPKKEASWAGRDIVENRCGFRKVPKFDVPVELRLVVIDVPDGVDENNQPLYKPSLQGVIFRFDSDTSFSTSKISLKVTYNKDTKQLILENSNIPNFPNPEAGWVSIFSRNINPGDETLTGESLRGVRFTGTMNVTKIAKE